MCALHARGYRQAQPRSSAAGCSGGGPVNNINGAHERRTRELLEALDDAVETREVEHGPAWGADPDSEALAAYHVAVRAYLHALLTLTEHITQQT